MMTKMEQFKKFEISNNQGEKTLGGCTGGPTTHTVTTKGTTISSLPGGPTYPTEYPDSHGDTYTDPCEG